MLIVTGDRDAYQLVEDPHVRVLYNRRGVSDYALYDEAGIEERTGVRPELYVQYAALRGDPSDNLPGVPGVGEKTAAKLINKYGGIDGIFEHIDEQTPKLRQNLGEAEGQVRQNAEVMVLLRDVELEGRPAPLRASDLDMDVVRKLFDFLEFRTLYDRLIEALGEEPSTDGPAATGSSVIEAEVTVVDTASEAAKLLESSARRVRIRCQWRRRGPVPRGVRRSKGSHWSPRWAWARSRGYPPRSSPSPKSPTPCARW